MTTVKCDGHVKLKRTITVIDKIHKALNINFSGYLRTFNLQFTLIKITMTHLSLPYQSIPVSRRDQQFYLSEQLNCS